MPGVSESQEHSKIPILSKVTEQLDGGLSTAAWEYLGKFDHGQTDGITCWRSDSIKRKEGSKIEGVGLFALEDIEPGKVIAIKPGHVVYGTTIKDNVEVIRGSHQQIGPNQFLTGLTKEEVERNLVGYNHSCDPNARVVVIKDVPLAFLISKKPIQKAEEVTVDYSVCHTSDTHRIFLCNCGSSKCRGVIQPGSDWMAEDFQKAHAGEFPYFIQEKIDGMNRMSEPERKAELRVRLVLRAADAINLLAREIEDIEKAINSIIEDARPGVHQRILKATGRVASNRGEMGRMRKFLFKYVVVFAKICPFSNIEDMGIDRGNPAKALRDRGKMGELVEFARKLDYYFNE